jgi:glutathione S-transferase
MLWPMQIHGFETSNNMKVRVALGHKGIDYTFHTIDPVADRAGIHELSGQFLTPVMVHGDTVLFDSAAILRYLDAQFRDTPRLFGTSQVEQWAIEDEEYFARVTLGGPVMDVMHPKVAGHEVPDEAVREAEEAMQEAVGDLAERLAGREWLVGAQLSAADIHAACMIHRVRRARLFDIEAQVAPIRAWLDRVMHLDKMYQEP